MKITQGYKKVIIFVFYFFTTIYMQSSYAVFETGIQGHYNVDCNALTDGNLSALVDRIRSGEVIAINLTNVEGVDIFRAIFTAIGTNRSITHLRIGSYRIFMDHPELFREFINMLIEHPTITHFYMDDTGVDDNGAKEIARLIEHNRVIISIKLERNELTQQGIDAISAALTRNRTLNYIGIAYNLRYSLGSLAYNSLALSIIRGLLAHKIPLRTNDCIGLMFSEQEVDPSSFMYNEIYNKDALIRDNIEGYEADPNYVDPRSFIYDEIYKRDTLIRDNINMLGRILLRGTHTALLAAGRREDTFFSLLPRDLIDHLIPAATEQNYDRLHDEVIRLLRNLANDPNERRRLFLTHNEAVIVRTLWKLQVVIDFYQRWLEDEFRVSLTPEGGVPLPTLPSSEERAVVREYLDDQHVQPIHRERMEARLRQQQPNVAAVNWASSVLNYIHYSICSMQ